MVVFLLLCVGGYLAYVMIVGGVLGTANKVVTNGMVGITTRRMAMLDPHATKHVTLLRGGAGAIGYNPVEERFVWCRHDGNGHGEEGFFIAEQVLGTATNADIRTTYTTKGTTRGIVLPHAVLSSTHYETKADSRVVGGDLVIFLEEADRPKV